MTSNTTSEAPTKDPSHPKTTTILTTDGKPFSLSLLPGERILATTSTSEPHAIFGSFGGKPLLKHTSKSYTGGGDIWDSYGGKSYVVGLEKGEEEYVVDYGLGKKKSYERMREAGAKGEGEGGK